jgi:hypothetical protein
LTRDHTQAAGPQAPQKPRTPWAWLKQWFGRKLARHLSREPAKAASPEAMADLQRFRRCLQPGDVILVEGASRFSTGIKYLTQSTWSHAALYVGESALANLPASQRREGARACIIEADLVDGVRAIDLDDYAGLPLRICRPVGLSEDEVATVVAHAVGRLGHAYDVKHIVDLLRWLMPMPPIPARFRRRLLTLGSGDPTRAICSALVAEALQSVRYPILPQVQRLQRVDRDDGEPLTSAVLEQRHASLLVPRDFDLSPYFEIVKPDLGTGFDHHRLAWRDAFVDPEQLSGTSDTDSAAPGSAPLSGPRRRRRVADAVDISTFTELPPPSTHQPLADGAGPAEPADAPSAGRRWWQRWFG